MKLKCLHGYFIIEEASAGEVSHFMSAFRLNVVPKKHYFTFKDLEDAPDYSIKNGLYLEAPALITFAGEPWEVMEANGLVYDFNTGELVQIASVTQQTTISGAGQYFISPGLILPGSITDDGKRVKDYAAWFSPPTMRFRYSEVNYVE